MTLKVYLATWRQTLVAVKLLLDTATSMGNIEATTQAVLSLSNPVMRSLKQVGKAMASLHY